MAQNTEKLLQEAKGYFELYEYEKTIKVCRDILLSDNSLDAKIQLAESYRLSNNFEQADYWYRQIMPLVGSNPTHKLNHAFTLQGLGKYDDAKKLFVEYAKFDIWGETLSKGCDMAAQLNRMNDKYQIQNLIAANSSGNDFGATPFGNGVIYCSDAGSGKSSNSWQAYGNFLDIYYSEKQWNQDLSPPQKLKGKANSSLNDGPIYLTGDGFKLYITRAISYKDKKMGINATRLGIVESDIMPGGIWAEPTVFQHNSPAYTVAHPAITPDGQTFLFASDMPGGFGGTDLYICTKIDTFWSQPLNLGQNINTPGNELFPFILADGTLFFASNGQAGLGGLDIYEAKRKGSQWTKPRNLGAPFNTNYDDFSYIVNPQRTEGYFSSNRPGGMGNSDIYRFLSEEAIIPIETGLPVPLTLTDVVIDNKLNDRAGIGKLPFKAGDWTILPQIAADLDKLVAFLNQQPELKIEIAAHTDSRGDDFMMQDISQKRADAIREYLFLRGIAPERLTATGYGETRLITPCPNNTPCAEAQHEANNRIEIKALEVSGKAVPQLPHNMPIDTANLLASVNTSLVDTVNAIPPDLSYVLYAGPYKEVDNITYYSFLELNTPTDLEYTDKGMMLVLGPYPTIADSELFEQYAKQRGAKRTEIRTLSKGAEIPGWNTKRLKKMGVK